MPFAHENAGGIYSRPDELPFVHASWTIRRISMKRADRNAKNKNRSLRKYELSVSFSVSLVVRGVFIYSIFSIFSFVFYLSIIRDFVLYQNLERLGNEYFWNWFRYF